jgi:hypothetical protein
MWTSATREDRFIKGRWRTPGNIFKQNYYDNEFIKKYVDIQGCFERDIPLIYAADQILKKINCTYHMLSMVDITNPDQNLKKEFSSNLFDLYKESLSKIKPSVHNIVFNYDWNNRKINNSRYDNHPLPLEHLEYLLKVLPEYKISDEIKTFVNNEQVKAINLYNINSKK